MSDFSVPELKALFDQLVSAVGTQDAAATFLGVSRQRVGQLISTSNNDLPTWAQVAKLEAVCGQSIVFGALARKVEAGAAQDALAASVVAAGASTAVLAEVHASIADGDLDAAEIDKVQARAREGLAAHQRLFDASMSLKPTRQTIQ
ncbi:hypothetical protein [Brevundimonas sp.]|uniref:hypothetical protein n=1 Tax=Brevundimonas sp. TaxID=1871086 RepID=UPI002FC9630B